MPDERFNGGNRQDNIGGGFRGFSFLNYPLHSLMMKELTSSFLQDGCPSLQLDKEEYQEILQMKVEARPLRIVKDSKGNEQMVVFHQIGGEIGSSKASKDLFKQVQAQLRSKLCCSVSS